MNTKFKKLAEDITKSLDQVKKASAKPLAKNEIELSVDNSGAFFLEFGSEISDSIKKSAKSWLNQKGFKFDTSSQDEDVIKVLKKSWFV